MIQDNLQAPVFAILYHSQRRLEIHQRHSMRHQGIEPQRAPFHQVDGAGEVLGFRSACVDQRQFLEVEVVERQRAFASVHDAEE
ncbi:MAG: hypothetical protein C5B51_21745 [Terriglobia bacterium]|nr:MAG: hypothetical protein C5B51_21745 [Terriglobia bacterium]